MTRFLNPKNDLAFKRLFGSEKHKDILIHFLNDIFARHAKGKANGELEIAKKNEGCWYG